MRRADLHAYGIRGRPQIAVGQSGGRHQEAAYPQNGTVSFLGRDRATCPRARRRNCGERQITLLQQSSSCCLPVLGAAKLRTSSGKMSTSSESACGCLTARLARSNLPQRTGSQHSPLAATAREQLICHSRKSGRCSVWCDRPRLVARPIGSRAS